jgi:hypothetical protein
LRDPLDCRVLVSVTGKGLGPADAWHLLGRPEALGVADNFAKRTQAHARLPLLPVANVRLVGVSVEQKPIDLSLQAHIPVVIHHHRR